MLSDSDCFSPSLSVLLSCAPLCSPVSSFWSSESFCSTSDSASARSKAASSLRAARAKLFWSFWAPASSVSAASALSPRPSRQRSSTWVAACGHASPDMASRASNASAALAGSWSRRVMRSSPSASTLSVSLARRLAATPSMKRPPTTSTRACSNAS